MKRSLRRHAEGATAPTNGKETTMPAVRLATRYPELAWELRTPDGQMAGRDEALDGETVWITRIAVLPPHRGHGHVAAILHAVLAHSLDAAHELAAVPQPAGGPGPDRDALRAWYTRHGFTPAPIPGRPAPHAPPTHHPRTPRT
ncbi:hypothetical protein [Streptacidiphilus sp. EB103A]|uniref:hypothetical protein n=1 Tax=Streptacidiphilus sp. EB103A TaxID=3156275 RepID=UPI003514A71B